MKVCFVHDFLISLRDCVCPRVGGHKKTAGVDAGGFWKYGALNVWALPFLRRRHRKIEVPEIIFAVDHKTILAGFSGGAQSSRTPFELRQPTPNGGK